MENNFEYTVYKHVGPTAKVYVGITKNSLQHRWGTDGSGYKGCPKFWNAIQKYGWDAFRHDIVAERLTFEEASALEIELIAKYTKQNKTYNIMPGGSSYPVEHKQNGPMPPKHRQAISKALKGKTKSPEHVEKVRQANIGKTIGYIWIKRGLETKHIPKEALYEFIIDGWELGRLPMSNDQRNQISKAQMGRSYSKEYRENMSKVMKGKLKGFISITKDNKNKRIREDELDQYLSDGWVRGWHIGIKLIFITKDGADKRIREDELDQYLSDGWVRGRSYKHSDETKQKIKHKSSPVWSAESRAKLSTTLKEHSPIRGKIMVNDGNVCKLILPTELDQYLSDGWTRGKLKKRK